MTVNGASSSSSSNSGSLGSTTITSNGNNLSSTIDWDALIQAAVQAKLAPATTISNSITANQAKITAYQKLQADLAKLTSDLTALNTSTINPLATNVFAARLATFTAANFNAQAALSMTIANGAATGDHTLQITQIATAQKVAGTTQSSQTDALGLSGTFSIGLAGGSSASVSVTSGMTLQDVADAINSQTSTSNVQASIVQVSSGSFEIVLSGTQDAADITYSSTSGDDILNKLGVTDSSGAFSNVIQASQDAEFTLDGIKLTRNTNDITDVLSGVTFSLLQPTPQDGSAIKISIGANTDQISTALQTFVTDYNTFRDDVIAQQASNPDGTAASSAVLFGDGTLRDIMTNIQQVLGTSVGGLTMSDLGLSFNGQNELQLDTGVLSSVLTTNLSGVMTLLSAQTTTSSSELAVANTGNSPQSFTLDLQVDASGNLTSASVNGDSSQFTIDGNAIIGAAGTIYAGMSFIYTGSTSQSITVTSTLGLAAQIYQIAKGASDTTSSSLQTQIDSLTTQDNTMTQKVNDIQSAAATYQASLKAQYSKYQAAIQQANTTLNYLSALLNSKSNN